MHSVLLHVNFFFGWCFPFVFSIVFIGSVCPVYFLVLFSYYLELDSMYFANTLYFEVVIFTAVY